MKLDLEKAYEKTDWSFLNSVIARKDLELNGDLRYRVVFPLPIFISCSMGLLKVSSRPQGTSDKVTPFHPFFSL